MIPLIWLPVSIALAVAADGPSEPWPRRDQPKIDPIFVWCHLCHASCGQPCRFGLRPGERYHDRRFHLAKVVERLRVEQPGTWAKDHVDIEHSLARGALCTDAGGMSGLCNTCGQTIARLAAITSA